MTARIALLIGVPIERRAFIRAALDPERHFTRQFAFDPVSAWEGDGGYQARVATPVGLLVEHAERQGLAVKPQAGLADLSDATATCDVVVVFAHWKGSGVDSNDLPLTDPTLLPGLLRRAVTDAPSDHEQEYLALAERLERAGADDVQSAAALLDDHVRQPVQDQGCATRSHAFPTAARHQTTAAERRAALDAALAGQLRPGNLLELCDGLHDMDSVVHAVDEAFDGVLDLTNCESTTLARRIDRARGGRCRIVQFESVLETETACLTLQQTLARLESGALRDGVPETHRPAPWPPPEWLHETYLAARARALDDVAQALAEQLRTSLLGHPEARSDAWCLRLARLVRSLPFPRAHRPGR